MKILVLIFSNLFWFVAAYSSTVSQNEPMRRITVFPFTASSANTKSSVEAWWKTREILANGKLFLVASKDFLQRKDVFQPRSELSPADVIILSELLDAQLILTGALIEKELRFNVYESKKGQLVWTSIKNLHPSIPVKNQIEKASEELTREFIENIPFHGFVYKDAIVGQTVYQKEGRYLVQAYFSTDIKVDVGDSVQFLNLSEQNNQPLFMGGISTEIFAEGILIETKTGWGVIEVQRINDLKRLTDSVLIRFPNEMKRIKEMHSLKDSVRRKIHPEYFSSDMHEIKSIESERRPLAAALAFLLNAAAFLLLAF